MTWGYTVIVLRLSDDDMEKNSRENVFAIYFVERIEGFFLLSK